MRSSTLPEEGSPIRGEDEREDPSFLSLVNVLLARPRLMVLLPVATAALSVLLFLLGGTSYQSASKFTPESTGARSSRVGALAAQFGIDVGGAGGGGESLPFYAQLIRSRDLLKEVATQEYVVTTNEGDRLRGSLLDLYGVEKDTEDEALKEIVSILREKISVTTDLNANVVTIRVEAPWPDLAERINRQVLESVNDYNVDKRRSMAASEREFVESRLETAEAELRSTEEALQRFLDANRSFGESAQLQFEYNRLSRALDRRQQVVSSLSQAFEQAKIEEVRTSPVINIIETPDGSATPTGGLLGRLILGGALGVLLATLLALMAAYWAAVRVERTAEFTQFRELSDRALRKLGLRRGRT